LDPTSLCSKLGGWEGQEQWESVAAWEEEERVDMWGPHASDTKERRRCGPKAQTKEGNVFEQRRHRHTGLLDQLGKEAACGE
jgi:hypothetical protein